MCVWEMEYQSSLLRKVDQGDALQDLCGLEVKECRRLFEIEYSWIIHYLSDIYDG